MGLERWEVLEHHLPAYQSWLGAQILLGTYWETKEGCHVEKEKPDTVRNTFCLLGTR